MKEWEGKLTKMKGLAGRDNIKKKSGKEEGGAKKEERRTPGAVTQSATE